MVLERTPVSAVGEALEYKVKPQVLDGKERNSGQLHTYATLALTLCPRKLRQNIQLNLTSSSVKLCVKTKKVKNKEEYVFI